MSKRCCAKSCYNSQMKNRMVHYFGFPKNEVYARKWAVAAGREDLLEKPIQNIIKYFLCSSHFTDDCFQDPPLNSKLKKTLRPVIVPIPTIFVSNIEQFMPGDEESLSFDTKETTATYAPAPNNISLLKRPLVEEALQEILGDTPSPPEMVPIYLDEYELPAKQIPDVHIPVLSEHDLELEERLEEMESPSDELIIGSNDYYVKHEDNQNLVDAENMLTEDDEEGFNQFTCRLCANDFFEQQLLFFQDDDQLIDLINSVLPRSVIQSDDYLPQQICISCLEKIRQCHEIMNDFEIVQERLMAS